MDGKLERFDNPFGSKIAVRRVCTSQLGFEKRLYSARSADDADPEWLEREFFQRVDDAAARALCKLNATPPVPLTELEESMWSVFVRTLYHRNPSELRAYLERAVEHWKIETPSAVEAALRRAGYGNDIILNSVYNSATLRNVEDTVLEDLPNVLMSARVGQFLNDLKKTIIDIPHHVFEFLISDAVPVRTNGLAVHAGHYALPLSPRRVLIAAAETTTLDFIKKMPPKKLVRAMNEQVVGLARHFVAATDRSQEHFVRNRFGSLV